MKSWTADISLSVSLFDCGQMNLGFCTVIAFGVFRGTRAAYCAALQVRVFVQDNGALFVYTLCTDIMYVNTISICMLRILTD